MTPVLALLLALTSLMMLGNGLVTPVLALYGAEFSASTTLIGMMITVFGLARLLINFPVGMASDRFGARTLLCAATLTLLAGAAAAAAATDIITLLVARAVQGVGSGIFMTMVGILVARSSQVGNRGRSMALYNGAIYTGAGFGPVAGGLLAQNFGLSAPFWAYAGVALLGFLVSLFAEKRAPAIKREAGDARLLPLLGDARFLAVSLMSALQGMVRTSAIWLLLPVLATERFGMVFAQIGLAMTLISVSNLVTLPTGGWLVDKFGSRIVTPLSTGVMGLAIAVVAFSGSVEVFWVGAVAIGLSSGLTAPAMGVATIEVSPPHLLGPVMGLQRTMLDSGFVGGPLLIGLLRDVFRLDVAGGLLTIAGLLLASGIFWLVAWGLPRPK